MTRKRLTLFAAVALILLSVAPAALAEHCFRCRFLSTYWECAHISSSIIGGWPDCWIEADGSCYTAGVPCQPHKKDLAPLELEYTVASVERLDEPHTTTDPNLLAAVGQPQPETPKVR